MVLSKSLLRQHDSTPLPYQRSRSRLEYHGPLQGTSRSSYPLPSSLVRLPSRFILHTLCLVTFPRVRFHSQFLHYPRLDTSPRPRIRSAIQRSAANMIATPACPHSKDFDPALANGPNTRNTSPGASTRFYDAPKNQKIASTTNALRLEKGSIHASLDGPITINPPLLQHDFTTLLFASRQFLVSSISSLPSSNSGVPDLEVSSPALNRLCDEELTPAWRHQPPPTLPNLRDNEALQISFYQTSCSRSCGCTSSGPFVTIPPPIHPGYAC